MAKRSILSAVREQREIVPAPPEIAAEQGSRPAVRPSRVAKLHIGGYFDPQDPLIAAFQKLGVDLRQRARAEGEKPPSQQDMLLEAIREYVAKHRAEIAFR